MRYQIVSDSSSNVFHLEGVNYTTVPMKAIAAKKKNGFFLMSISI